jgi:hypothetical protein
MRCEAGSNANFFASLLLSQGVPMVLAGDELGHTQLGNNNAYCQDSADPRELGRLPAACAIGRGIEYPKKSGVRKSSNESACPDPMHVVCATIRASLLPALCLI